MDTAARRIPAPARKAAALGIVLPAKNDAVALPERLGRRRSVYSGTEILLIGDGSTDATADAARLARDHGSQASLWYGLANQFYNALASLLVGHRIEALISDFGAVRANKFRKFLYLLPNGFPYPTSMAFFRADYSVVYVPIEPSKRNGCASHIRPLRDGARFLLIIFKVATLCSPLKIFMPASAVYFVLGCTNCAYTFIQDGRLIT